MERISVFFEGVSEPNKLYIDLGTLMRKGIIAGIDLDEDLDRGFLGFGKTYTIQGYIDVIDKEAFLREFDEDAY